MGLSIYNGSSWSSQASSFKIYNGVTWFEASKGYVYDGSLWKQFWPEAPANTASPTYSVSPEFGAGSTFTATSGTWTNSPTSYSYQWQKAPFSGSYSNISGATSSSYTTVSADTGYQIRVAVTATNSRGSTTAYSSTYSGSYLSPQRLTGATMSKIGTGQVYVSWNSSIGAGTNGVSSPYYMQYSGNGLAFTEVYPTTTNYTINTGAATSIGIYVQARTRIAGSTIDFGGSGMNPTGSFTLP